MNSLKAVLSTAVLVAFALAFTPQTALACTPAIKVDAVTGEQSSHPDLAAALAELSVSLSVADATK